MEPMQMFAINYLGPFTLTSVNGFKYVLVGVDYTSRYLIATPTKEAKAHVSWQFMVDHVSVNFGWPDEVFSDNESRFTALEFTDQLKQVNVKHRRAPAKAPWVVGLVEPFVKMILNVMRAHSAGGTRVLYHWDEYIGQATQAINTRCAGPHGYSPADVFLESPNLVCNGPPKPYATLAGFVEWCI